MDIVAYSKLKKTLQVETYKGPWSIGSLNGTTGAEEAGSINSITKLIVVTDHIIITFLLGDYDFIVYFYNKDGSYSHRTFESMGRINSGVFRYDNTYNLRILAHTKNSTQITGKNYPAYVEIDNYFSYKNTPTLNGQVLSNFYTRLFEYNYDFKAHDSYGKNIRVNKLCQLVKADFPVGTAFMYQSLCCDEDNIYILFPDSSNDGTIGVIQQYKKDGTYVQTASGNTTGKPNDSAFYDGHIYCRESFVVDEETGAASVVLTKIDITDWSESEIEFDLPDDHHCAGLTIVDGIIYFACQIDVFPLTKYYIDAYNLGTKAFVSTTEVTVNHEFRGIQGFKRHGDLFYCINSPYDAENPAFVADGFYIDISTSAGVTLNTIECLTFAEPEGIDLFDAGGNTYAVIGYAGVTGIYLLRIQESY